MNAPVALNPQPTLAVPAAWRHVVAMVAVVVVLRLGVMLLSGAGLHVDEAQYWWWSLDLQWGYLSKPPLIAALIAASTSLFGEGLPGVRLLALACWPAAAAMLYGLGRDIGGAGVGRWAALIWLASPLAGLLGLVATTDAPLVLAWSAALWALWRAVVLQRQRAWWVLGLALGLGLLAKYTMAALLLGALPWAWRHGGNRRGLALALAMAALIFMPHLVWNASQGWPTWQHTVESSDASTGGVWSAPARVGLLWLGQCLVLGPVAVLLGLRCWRSAAPSRAARDLWLASVLPLLVIGMAQALRGRFEQNWLAPMHLGLALGLGLAAAGLLQPSARRWRHALLTQAAAVVLLALGPALVARAPALVARVAPGDLGAWRATDRWLPPALDPWARMRGWTPALAALAPAVPPAPPGGWRLVSPSRAVLAQTLYAWRDQPLHPVGWIPDGAAPHHFTATCPWARARRHAEPLLVLSEGPLPPALAADLIDVQALGQARAPRSRGREIDLRLYRATPRTPGPAATTDEPPGECR